MSRTLALVLSACLACACARSPDASAPPKATASAEANALTAPDAGLEAGGPVPGLPMPQHYPRFAWDAAGVDASRDAATR